MGKTATTATTRKASTPASESASGASQFRQHGWADKAFQYTMAGLLVGAVSVMSLVSPDFRDPDNLVNILQQNAIIGVVACGMTLMIIAGGFDLSVGSVAAAAGVTSASLSLRHGFVVSVIVGLLVGLLVGLVNGTVIAKAKINAFVATLGMSAIVQGLLFVKTEAKPVFRLPDTWINVGLFKLGFVPSTVLVFVLVALLCWALLRYTLLGKLIYSVGSNLEGTRRSGVPVDRVVISAFAIGGLLAALGGVMLVTQSGTGQPSAGATWALLAIAAVVVGGTPLTGGGGGIAQTVVGTLLLGVMSNILNLTSVSPYWQPAATGFLVLSAVGVERFRSRGKR